LIFDRWGEKIFQTNQLGKWWDGTYRGNPVQMDVYVYKIKLKEERTNLKHEYKGTVSVIR
jgi:gliding motility-associated-like protein